MKILTDLEQGSDEWLAARLGIPTASNFSKLITSTGKKSTQLDGYALTLAAETLMGKPEEGFKSEWMDRGTELEPMARAWYEFQTDIVIEEVGFVLSDDGSVGCSPDGLSTGNGLELKCPKAETHIGYLCDQKLPTNYVPQVQGCIWLCERDQWDFASFHPDMPGLLLTIPRDDAFIAMLAKLVAEVNEKKLEILHKIERMAA